jgi:uncharacterized protein (TIGR02300 family)
VAIAGRSLIDGGRPSYRSAEVAKPEWGTKRICPSCSTRYYDFGKALGEIACPRCGTNFDPEAFLKTRRARVVAPEKELEPVAADEVDADIEVGEEEVETIDEEGEEALPAEEGEEEEEEEELIEDASELGEDEDDMAEVIENVEDEDER